MTYAKEGYTEHDLREYMEKLEENNPIEEKSEPDGWGRYRLRYFGNPIIADILIRKREIARLKKEKDELETNYRHYKNRYEELLAKVKSAVPPQA